MKLYLKTKNVLDEREMQEMYRIEHRGLWLMYVLLCASVVVQLLFGAPPIQMAGEMGVIGIVSVALMVAYARRGIWDAHERPSVRGNAVYAALTAFGVGVVVLGKGKSIIWVLASVAAVFLLCFVLLTALMAYVCHRQSEQEDALDD